MTSIALARTDVIVGVDTHKDQHVAVAIDGLGGRLNELFVPATNDGYAQLLAWADGQGRVGSFGVEGTGSYGVGLARFLRRHGRTVVEVSRPPRKAERRAAGKSDTIDAEHAARQVLAGTSTATPKTSDGDIETLRLVKVARDTAVKAHSQAMITLKATLVTASDELRAQLEPLTNFKLITACAAFEAAADLTGPDVAMRHVLGARAAGSSCMRRSRSTRATSRRAPPPRLPNWSPRSGSVPTSPPSCSSPPATTATGSAPRQPWPTCAVPADPSIVGQDHPASAQPRRQPPGPLRAVSSGRGAHALARTDHRLRRTPHHRGTVQARDHPLPQTLPCP